VTPQESAVGAGLVAQMSLAKDNRIMRVLTVPAGTAAAAVAKLRAQAGVVSVGISGQKRHALTVSPYYTNDPYFTGFTAAQNATAGNAATSTYKVLPYAETATDPGQWDMHAIGLEHAYGYSQANNGSNVSATANALGSNSVNIAIIDTGEDINHPELASKIVRQRCFITNEGETAQSTSDHTLDEAGHGTDVSGIAAADSNNGFGFTGAGGNVNIFAYRVFPTPDDSCASDDSADDQCEADTADIASAITDAVNAGANVISMSLGGGGGTGNSGCTGNGVDSDSTEGTAIAYAISHNVIVVAAAGNSGSSGEGVAAPGCDTGVIAVGATSIDDGTGNGTGSFGGTSSAPVEYVASYSQYGSPGTAINSSSAWGIVAPGGDPSSDSDDDNLHWINNIWTTTPYESSANDENFLGYCAQDYPSSLMTGNVDCQTLIAGTSMATPHVAGAVALILSVSSAYSTPALMKGLLCSTADQLTATGSTQNQGCGRLNVYRAMATALGDSALP
jgi:subtilisin family serine protease